MKQPQFILIDALKNVWSKKGAIIDDLSVTMNSILEVADLKSDVAFKSSFDVALNSFFNEHQTVPDSHRLD